MNKTRLASLCALAIVLSPLTGLFLEAEAAQYQEGITLAGSIPGARPRATLPEGRVVLTLPHVNPQLPSEAYNCGPNSAARLLRFYGHSVSYELLKLQRDNEYGDTWAATQLGTTPHALRTIMSRWAGDKVHVQRNASMSTLLKQLLAGRPVIALVRVGRAYETPVIPALHWVVVNGFDSKHRVVYYVDTNGEQREVSYKDFTSGGIGTPEAPAWNWSMGDGAVSSVLNANGVVAGTFIWIDREPLTNEGGTYHPTDGYKVPAFNL